MKKLLTLLLVIFFISCEKNENISYSCQRVELNYTNDLNKLTTEHQKRVNSLLNSNYSNQYVSDEIKRLSDELSQEITKTKRRYKQNYPKCNF